MQSGATNVKASSITFSGLLNAIDGVAAQVGGCVVDGCTCTCAEERRVGGWEKTRAYVPWGACACVRALIMCACVRVCMCVRAGAGAWRGVRVRVRACVCVYARVCVRRACVCVLHYVIVRADVRRPLSLRYM